MRVGRLGWGRETEEEKTMKRENDVVRFKEEKEGRVKEIEVVGGGDDERTSE
jgi:hypothetical protein